MGKIVLIILLAFSVKSLQAFAGVDTNATYLKILEASNNVSRIIQTLPDVEKLWPQEPDAYLKSINQAAHVLAGAPDDSNAKQALLNSFTSLMQKPCPTNEEQAASWIELKRDATSFYLDSGEIRDKSNWLAVAKFLGEIRSKRIPNYTGLAMTFSGVSNIPAEELKMQKAIEDNKRREITNEFQSQLWQADSMLMTHLQYICPYIQPNKPVDTNFVNQVVSAAHLTTEESKALQRR